MPNPSESNPNEREKLLNAYLDEQLAPEEREAMEQLLKEDKGLSEIVELQGEIDASLMRSFRVPSLSAEKLAEISEQADLRKRRRFLGLPIGENQNLPRVAAAIAACFALVFLGLRVYDQVTDDGYRLVALQDIYKQCVENGFQPKWVCEDDKEFAETFARRQGQAMLIHPIPDGEMVGLAYLRGLTRKATTMLARVDGEPILVFVVRRDRDPKPDNPSWTSGLNLFRKELEDLVLYEVSPLDEARVMDSFYVTDEYGSAR